MLSRDLVPIRQECAGLAAIGKRLRLGWNHQQPQQVAGVEKSKVRPVKGVSVYPVANWLVISALLRFGICLEPVVSIDIPIIASPGRIFKSRKAPLGVQDLPKDNKCQ
jgi:hypothetical protein